MLVLSRKPGQSVQIGAEITCTILKTKSNQVRIGITAPDWVHILRTEIAPEVSSTPVEESEHAAASARNSGHDRR
jgi:carbon storage regulator